VEGEEPEAARAIDEEAARNGAERAAKLRLRFDKWFYVISDASFKQIHKDRTELFKAVTPPAAEG
jgi:arginine utilization protein RocB